MNGRIKYKYIGLILIWLFLPEGLCQEPTAQPEIPQAEESQPLEEINETLTVAEEAASESGPVEPTPKVLELSLEKVTELALNNSLDIQIAKFNAYISRTGYKKVESLFDTFLNAQVSYEKDKLESASPLAASRTEEYIISAGLEKKLPSGTTVALDLSDTRTDAEGSLSTLNPYYESSIGLSLTQELGRNFFGLADRSQIALTKLDIENSDFTSLDDIETAIYNVQETYWNLVLKDERLAIAEEMLKEAGKLYQIYQNKYPLGLVEESELLAVEALVYTRKSEVEIAKLERLTAKNDLFFLINRPDFMQEVSLSESLFFPDGQASLCEALRRAIESRRDYKRIKNDLEKNDIDIIVKKNALWPQIDLEASLVRNNIDAHRARAWGNLGQDANDELFLKLTFKLPLENRQARSEQERVRLETERYLLKIKQVECRILREINNLISRINILENQAKLLGETVNIHRKKLDFQIKRLAYGRSNSDTLINYEEDLLRARLSLADNLFNYRVSLIKLDLAENSLLDKYWQEPL
ncbi:MAG: TolC family protein [Candidatus Omnitrophota bacterium]